MQRKRNSVQVSELGDDFYLPEECWECIFKFLNENFKSLSVVSKQFLSITNRLRFSFTLLLYPNLPFFLHLFQRFTNLTSIDFSRVYCDLSTLLHEISRFPLNITSLNLSNRSNFPANGLI